MSENQKFFAYLQTDGNLCVRNGTPGGTEFFKWGSWQSKKSFELEGSKHWQAQMQADGNLVITREGNFKWGSHQASGHKLFYSPDYELLMQNDGNLCIREKGNFVWGSWQDAKAKGFAYDLYEG